MLHPKHMDRHHSRVELLSQIPNYLIVLPWNFKEFFLENDIHVLG